MALPLEEYTPVATPLASAIGVMQDGCNPTGANLSAAEKALANAVRDLQNKVDPAAAPGGGSAIPRLMGRTVLLTGGNATYALLETAPQLPVVAVSGTYFFQYRIDPPNGSTLVSVRGYVYSPGASQSLTLYEMDHQVPEDLGGDIDNVPTVTQLATVSSAPTLVADPYHYLTLVVPGSVVIDRTAKSYFVHVAGVADSDTKWFEQVRVTFTPATADLGAG